MSQFRQGDVLLVPISTIPESAKIVERDNGRIILAYGEVTGHAHAVCDRTATKLADGIAEYLSAPNGATLTHEEHSAIAIPPGDYRIIHQREYSPQEIRRVAD